MLIVLFGTGKASMYYRSLLYVAGIDIFCYADNDENTWGNRIEGKVVLSAQELSNLTSVCILISTTKYEEEIRKQLCELGLGSKVVSLEELLYKYLIEDEKLHVNAFFEKTPSAVIFDALDGCGWAGTEVWSFRLARGLRKRERNAIVYRKSMQRISEEYAEYAEYAEAFDIECYGCLRNIIRVMIENMPFVYFDNFNSIGMIAARCLKKRYKAFVKIVSVLHGDNRGTYDGKYSVRFYADRWLCVNPEIRRTFLHKYVLPEDKVYARTTFVEYSERISRTYSHTGQPLRICWAGRLTSALKRADKIPEIIEALIQNCDAFCLSIAGIGELYEKLKEYIHMKKLSEKVKLLGLLDAEAMKDLFLSNDVFISFSESEGGALAMLEAMSFGCVPVVTDVVAAKGIVQSGINGYVCQQGNVDELARRIRYLSLRRECLPVFGERCRAIIKEKCTIEDYLDFLEQEVLNFDEEGSER